MNLKTVYKRVLPEHLVGFSSAQGKALFKEALDTGGMESYFKLAEQFTTQAEPAYCGPTSLVMVLNALNMDPGKPWKGIWRWYSEEVLHCSDVEAMKQGISLQ
jgi:glutathione gamma-glutamylcysteinyltransferase